MTLCNLCVWQLFFSNPHTRPLKALSDPFVDQSALVYHLFWSYKQQRASLNMVVAMLSGNVSWHPVGQPSAGSLVLFEKPKGHFGRLLWPLSKSYEMHRPPNTDLISESFYHTWRNRHKELKSYIYEPNIIDAGAN